ncbi:phosphoribosylamine--glycine ligase [Candidatus Curtissbacteria bacterium RBG_13_35_7]|uniref:phosphoribosylamine--glycine ligase n=1 Tax=Candidatus Curtissbacteria bacterium RBG_13_35_7 TaxID=1797705 RepID=A0A1F5G1E9_9BACT|nr:MAG: phosphoribosylamine--glycine ligase [Candidatus Curtissbacteria bacterium RBG_13_35_7]
MQKQGFNTFGPTKEAGQIEWDKAWARRFMKKNKIPSPLFKICKSQKEGIKFIKNEKDGQWYIKASGLAAGKGALFAKNNKEALAKIKQMKSFGRAGKIYLIEECLTGEEFSSFAIINGKNYQIIGHAQDHKTVYDGNLGPNTGGMGCSSPPQVVTRKIENQVEKIIKKTAISLVKLKRPYNGILYFGGIVDEKGKVYCIEFNSRWGDPEAQALIPAIKNDFCNLIASAAAGKLQKIKKDKLYRVVVAAASKGYPTDYSKVAGKEIKGLSKLIKKGIIIFGAGVKKKGNKYITSSGRLFYVLGEGKNIIKARQKAYNALSFVSIAGDNLHYRTDIGYRDLKRINK